MKCPLNGMSECDFDCALMVTFDKERQAGCGLAVLAVECGKDGSVDLVNALVKNAADKKGE